MRSRHRVLAVLAAVVLAVVGLTGGTADRRSPGSPSWAGVDKVRPPLSDHLGPADAGRAQSNVATVTLITGDRVRLTTERDGHRTVTPVPGKGRGAEPFSIRYRGDRIDVVPADAAPLVLAGKLDGRLFDVAGLVAAGLDDARSREIPLLVTYAHDRSGPVVSRGTSAVRAAPSSHTTKMVARKADAAAFWQWIAGPHPSEAGAVEAAAAIGGVGGGGGVERVALDMAKRPSRVEGGPGAAGTRPSAATHRLRLRLIDRNGRLATDLSTSFLTQPVVLNRDTEDVIDLQPAGDGLVAKVPDGHYSFGEIVVTSHGFKPNSYTLLARPDFEVTGNLTLTLDARNARQVRVSVDAPDARPVMTSFGSVETFAGRPWSTLVTLPGSQRYRLYATPTGRVTDRAYDFAMYQSLTSRRATYDIVVGRPGQIPAHPSYRVHDRDLATEHGTFFAGGAGLNVKGVWFREAELPGDVQLGLGWFYDTPIPARRTHLATPTLGGTALPWASSLDVEQINGPLWYTEMRDPAVAAAGSATTRLWGSAGLGPQGSGLRTGAMMDVRFEPFSGAEPGSPRVIVWNDDGISGEATLRREGTMAGHAGKPFLLRSMPQPAQMSRFTLDLDAKRSVPWSRYATQVRATWDFTCDTPSTPTHPMRILNIRPTGDFDMYGRAPAGRSFRLDIPVDMVEDSGRIVETTLMVSYDDGATWAKVTTIKDSNTRWHAMLTHPDKPGGFVSLRTSVTTDSGHKASLTTIRAYGLAPTAG